MSAHDRRAFGLLAALVTVAVAILATLLGFVLGNVIASVTKNSLAFGVTCWGLGALFGFILGHARGRRFNRGNG